MNWLQGEMARFRESAGMLASTGEILPRFDAALQAPAQRWVRDAKIAAVERTLDQLPRVTPTTIACRDGRIEIGRPKDLSAAQAVAVQAAMKALIPWRKGPFDIFGQRLDSEWASHLKWNRLKDHIAPLAGRRILDIGSSSGYYLWRMAEAAPRLALGIEPYLIYFAQYLFLQHWIGHPQIFCLPLKLDQLPDLPALFDTLFCMGVLYHTKEPLQMLARMRRLLAPGGELVLETLVIDAPANHCLCPPGRYAKMANVWFIPSRPTLTRWLERCGFTAVRCIDTTATTTVEQRRTRWMPFESLDDFLDPANPAQTIEGHPAPLRAMLLATAA
ncbi:MAG: tRNA 5-methoxyuridine(34)/uridine 5-oxyacetic acid(34) synthase CmoB [Desulfosarcinaceae bacterium]|nr:tRNA 5-methoxyuridine(34)/uridine 5-oxyacetic acid(34) synthase CmoB [Desulfosarcinaceae bacterium]